MIKIVEGNILNASEDIICHQVNCQGVMGSGLAKQIRSKYAEVYDKYIEYCNYMRLPSNLLGRVLPVKCLDGKVIFNLFGQLNYGRDKQYTDYSALEAGLRNMKEYAQNNQLTVAIPYQIGCGLAGGNWDIVSKVIEEVFSDYHATIYKLK